MDYYLDFDDSAPTNLAAESAILGSVMLDDTQLKGIREKLDQDDFYLASNQTVLRAMCELQDSGVSIDLITMADLVRKKKLDVSVAYMASLTEGLPRLLVLDDYIRILKEKSQLRKVMKVCLDAYDRASRQDGEAKDIGRQVFRELKQLFKGE